MRATTPRSCVISSTAMPRCACSRFRRSSTCAWIVTSSAVVGSSAINSSGSPASAMAIIARCFIPPDIWNGNSSSRRRASGMPTASSRSTARLRAAAAARSRMSRQHLADLQAHRQHRIEAGSRLLKDHRHVAAAHLAHLGFRHRQQLATRQAHAARHDAAGIGQQAHERQRRHRLAATRLAQQGIGFARPHGEGNVIHRTHDPAGPVDPGGQTRHFQQRSAHVGAFMLPPRRLCAAASACADQRRRARHRKTDWRPAPA